MSHIAFDLDALPLVPKVARSAGIGEAVVGWGLTQMWEWCWREKTDRVTTNHLRGFFGSELGAILVDFGFLEAIGASLWRVKGAARYLRIQAARELGGKKAAAAGNLRRGPARPGPSAGPGAGEGAGASPQLTPSSSPAGSQLPPRPTATSDERLATSEQRQAGEAPTGARGGTRDDWQALIADATASGVAAYRVDRDKDPPALKAMLALAPLEEIRARWRRGLANAKSNTFPRVTSIAELRQHWNRLGVDPNAPRTAPAEQHTEGRTHL